MKKPKVISRVVALEDGKKILTTFQSGIVPHFNTTNPEDKRIEKLLEGPGQRVSLPPHPKVNNEVEDG